MPQNLEHSGSSWKGQTLKHGDSIIDRLDARVRVMSVALFAFAVVLSPGFWVAFSALVLAILLVRLAKLDLKRTLRRLFAMDMFMLFLIVMLPFTTPASSAEGVLFTLGSLSASKAGLLHALLITCKANAVVLALLSLLGTLSAIEFGHALAKLKVPEKLVHLLMFTVRYLEVIGQEYKRMRRAMQARAFVLRANRHTWRSIGYLVGMLLIHALERSERIMDAMKCRGYQGRFYLLDDSRLVRRDYYFAVCAAVTTAALVLLNFL